MSDTQELLPPLNKHVTRHDCCHRCHWFLADIDDDNRDFWFCIRELNSDGEPKFRYHRDETPSLEWEMICDRYDNVSNPIDALGGVK